jgi:hypothetical protein
LLIEWKEMLHLQPAYGEPPQHFLERGRLNSPSAEKRALEWNSIDSR